MLLYVVQIATIDVSVAQWRSLSLLNHSNFTHGLKALSDGTNFTMTFFGNSDFGGKKKSENVRTGLATGLAFDKCRAIVSFGQNGLLLSIHGASRATHSE